MDEARDILAGVVLAHVPVVAYDFRQKRAYVAVMIRRILHAMVDRSAVDDKDYYGNKRLELAGQLLALLFEDCFKRLNADLKRQADAVLSKSNRATQFDILKCIRQVRICMSKQSQSWILFPTQHVPPCAIAHTRPAKGRRYLCPLPCSFP